jgi:hypothetical protein
MRKIIGVLTAGLIFFVYGCGKTELPQTDTIKRFAYNVSGYETYGGKVPFKKIEITNHYTREVSGENILYYDYIIIPDLSKFNTSKPDGFNKNFLLALYRKTGTVAIVKRGNKWAFWEEK